jgi:putative membrane protein
MTMSDTVNDIFAQWRLPMWLTLSVVVTAAVYIRGWMAVRKTRPEQLTNIRLFSFLSGLGVLWIAVGSPMDGFADALLSAHMVEHLLLMSAVPPLLLYGLPVVPLLRGLPTPFTRAVIGPLLRFSALRHFGQWMVQPAVAWLLMNLAYLGWHIPSAYNFALEHENWHTVEHLCFLGTSILFWYCILWPWPASVRRRNWGILVYLVGADLVNTMLSAFLAFCDRPVYRYYIDNPNPFGVSVLKDQVLGAAIMWVLGSLAYLGPIMIITFQLLVRHPTHLRDRI